MQSFNRFGARKRLDLSLILFIVFVCALWIAGGASRADVSGQALVRAVSWSSLIVLILFKSDWSVVRGKPVILFLAAGAALVALQLIPLPPSIWQALPGRTMFVDATAIGGDSMPWRPWAIYPSGAFNALGSLIVPCVALCLVTGHVRLRDETVVTGLLCLVLATMLVGLLQFAGIPIRTPLVNGNVDVSGTMANRNHFALLMACGLPLLSVWAFGRPGTAIWRAPAAIGLALVLLLAILGSGSRAGMAVGLVALACSAVMVRSEVRVAQRHLPRWTFPVALAGMVLALAVIVVIGMQSDRAVAVQRALTVDPAQDMRSRSFTPVVAMVRDFFPFGSGFGGFDAVFRIHEPFDLLKPTYFNRAHNDYLEILLDAGVPGLLLLMAGLGWWLWMSARSWRTGRGKATLLPKLGSTLLLLVFLASIVDYPARTPIIMALVVIAAVWLSEAGNGHGSRALPERDHHL
jgi:O-antigen ligase